MLTERKEWKKKKKKYPISIPLVLAVCMFPASSCEHESSNPAEIALAKKTECFLNVVFSPFCLVTNATRGLVNGFSSSNTYSACNPHSLDAHYCFKYNSSKRVQTRSRTETQRRGKKGGRVRERGVFEVRLSGAMFGTKGEQWGE